MGSEMCIRDRVDTYLPSSVPWRCEAQISNVYLNEGEYLFAAVVPLFGYPLGATSDHELLWVMETDVSFRKQSRADIRSRGR